MSTSVATISWNFVPGSISTLVEYRVTGTITWIRPSFPMNPTATNEYPLTITDNVTYDVRLTTNGINCGPRSTTFTMISSFACCPSGYTLSDNGTFCFQTNTTDATPPSDPVNTVSSVRNDYTICGTYIYSSFNTNGTGLSTIVSTSNPFWVNGTGGCFVAGDTSSGPLNRSGLWAIGTPQPNQIIGFSVCITVPEDKIYYVGMGVDNIGILRIDGATIIQQDPAALDIQYGLPGGSSTFRIWHVYPIEITAGTHVMELVGQNGSPAIPNPAAMGMEIYNNTSAEIAVATSYTDLNLIFSTKDFIGQPVQIGSGGTGYTCPDGFSLVLCDGPAFCTQTLTIGTIPCTTTTSTTTTTTTSTTTTTTTSTTTTTTTTA